MADLSSEPSMEDILSSIKRIIAEENDTLPGRTKRPERSVPRRGDVDPAVRDDILELREAVAAAMPTLPPISTASATAPTATQPEAADVAPVAEPAPTPRPPAPPSVAENPGILSQRTADATRGPLDTLSRLVVKPETPGSDTLESMVREMLRPMLREWLDANLPHMVEAMVAKEIDRITGK
jgi:cell pole-organizing protein PopZ